MSKRISHLEMGAEKIENKLEMIIHTLELHKSMMERLDGMGKFSYFVAKQCADKGIIKTFRNNK